MNPEKYLFIYLLKVTIFIKKLFIIIFISFNVLKSVHKFYFNNIIILTFVIFIFFVNKVCYFIIVYFYFFCLAVQNNLVVINLRNFF